MAPTAQESHRCRVEQLDLEASKFGSSTEYQTKGGGGVGEVSFAIRLKVNSLF